MFYFFKYNLLLLSTVFFKKVHLNGFEKLPKGKPILFASNHSNSFLDGIILENYIKRPLYVLVRGDVFESKFTNWFYRAVRLLPIYRATDTDPRAAIGKNNASFDECYEFFKKGRSILIFSEAISRTEKKVRPIRKGTARMAFDMETRSDFELGLHVVPMGINYTHFKGYGKELMVSIGDPIPVAEYKEQYEQNRAKATNHLTKRIEQDIKNEVVEINDPELYQVADLYLDTKRDAQDGFLGKFHWSRKRLKSEKEYAETFNKVIEEKPSFANTLANFGQALQTAGLKVFGLNRKSFPWWSLLHNIIFLPLAILGFVMYHFIPILSTNLANNIAKQDQFKDSLIYGFSMAFFVIIHLISCIVLVAIFGWIGLLYLPLVYVVKHSYFNWKTHMSYIRNYLALKRVQRNKDLYQKINSLHQEILNIA